MVAKFETNQEDKYIKNLGQESNPQMAKKIWKKLRELPNLSSFLRLFFFSISEVIVTLRLSNRPKKNES